MPRVSRFLRAESGQVRRLGYLVCTVGISEMILVNDTILQIMKYYLNTRSLFSIYYYITVKDRISSD